MGKIDQDVVLASIKLSDDANIPNDVWPPERSTKTLCWQALNCLTMPIYLMMYGLQTPLLVHSSIKIVEVNAILDIHRCAFNPELALMGSS